ncbi:interleukin-11 receptor subunit alpha isoform X2 [Echeneis naucrates]|uniref:interleukin-11 receptor subunit alpha isoform X2 n=1 Tax=Echeneis naucrates TaxID=173247 RepID=UPI001113AE10|nr:ciliary neurotrophic factor receptor subunit alpha-like isoform X2 [Echeneis naucrates]
MLGFLSSPVCLTVIWFLSWSLHHSCAQISTDEVSGVHYGHLGKNVTLACGKSQRIPVVWHLNRSSVLPWHKVASDGALVLLRVDHSAQGIYSCYDNRGLLLHSTKLRMGYPPGLLSISCQVPSHAHVRCSWVESIKTFLPVQYNASLGGIGQDWKPCVVDVSRKHCDVYDPPFWQTIHTLRVTVTNALGSETTDARLKLHELLKPDPPESVLVKEIEGYPRRLMVLWKSPPSWPLHDSFPLLFQIRYRPVGSVYWSEIFSEHSPAVVFDALAGHLHQVQIRAHDEVNTESQWSEWSPMLLIQPWTVYTTTDPPTEEPFQDYDFPFNEKPETSTEKSHNPALVDVGNLVLVILLVLFSVVILITVPSLIYVLWVRQRRRDHGTKQELTSMVKMKSMPI